jgi:hypothetical protein
MIENGTSLHDGYAQYPKKYLTHKSHCFDFKFNFTLRLTNFSNVFFWETDEMNETFLSPSDIINFKKYKDIMVEKRKLFTFYLEIKKNEK